MEMYLILSFCCFISFISIKKPEDQAQSQAKIDKVPDEVQPTIPDKVQLAKQYYMQKSVPQLKLDVESANRLIVNSLGTAKSPPISPKANTSAVTSALKPDIPATAPPSNNALPPMIKSTPQIPAQIIPQTTAVTKQQPIPKPSSLPFKANVTAPATPAIIPNNQQNSNVKFEDNLGITRKSTPLSSSVSSSTQVVPPVISPTATGISPSPSVTPPRPSFSSSSSSSSSPLSVASSSAISSKIVSNISSNSVTNFSSPSISPSSTFGLPLNTLSASKVNIIEEPGPTIFAGKIFFIIFLISGERT